MPHVSCRRRRPAVYGYASRSPSPVSADALGANGLTLEYPVKRHATNLEPVLTYEDSSESPDDH